MKVTIVSPNLSNNCLGRAYILAELLVGKYQVEIVGTTFGDGIWPPASSGEFEYRTVPGSGWPRFARSFARLTRMIDGDIVIASKPLATSFGAALASVSRRPRPLVLDIDDDEVAMVPAPRLYRPSDVAYHLMHPNGAYATRAMRSKTGLADCITVASQGLRSEFGGTVIRHAKDTNRLRPEPGRMEEAKAMLGLSGHDVVMFLGSPQPWKGVHVAAAAMSLMSHRATLAVIGADASDSYTTRIRSFPHVAVFAPRPISELPFLIQAADVIVIPQELEAKSSRQLPSKLLDAMAAGKPVIATAVGDLPEILGHGRGMIVPPADPVALAEALDRVLDTPGLAAEMGKRARIWCVQHASYGVVGAQLECVLSEAISRASLRMTGA